MTLNDVTLSPYMAFSGAHSAVNEDKPKDSASLKIHHFSDVKIVYKFPR